MKRIRLAAFLTVILLLSGCGAKEETTVDLTAFFERLNQSYAWGETYFMEQDEESLESLYPGLKDLPAKQLVVKVPRMSAAVNEYVFAEFETEEDAETAGEILRQRVQTQAQGGAWYPAAMEAWEQAKVLVQGRYVAMIAGGENQEALEKAWEDQFKA